jgi:hypothetical protein
VGYREAPERKPTPIELVLADGTYLPLTSLRGSDEAYHAQIVERIDALLARMRGEDAAV